MCANATAAQFQRLLSHRRSHRSSREIEQRLSKLEELIAQIGAIDDSQIRERTDELIRTLLELQCEGFHRTLEIVRERSSEGERLIRELGEDSLVSNLLLLHGLHPVDLATRVRRALEGVKPRLAQHGGSVHLIDVTPAGAVRLQLEGNCEGCPSSRMTLKYSIEEALFMLRRRISRHWR